jgi:hypothetical protein
MICNDTAKGRLTMGVPQKTNAPTLIIAAIDRALGDGIKVRASFLAGVDLQAVGLFLLPADSHQRRLTG